MTLDPQGGGASRPMSNLPVKFNLPKGMESGVAMEKEGDLIHRYKLLQQIGEGGFGAVWMAEQTEPIVRKVALKVIKADLARSLPDALVSEQHLTGNLSNRLSGIESAHIRIDQERSDRIAALAAQLSALLNGDQVYAGSNHYMGAVVATNTANVLHGKFVGDGSGLQSLPVGSLNGVLGNGQLPGTVVYRPELLSTNAALNAQLNQEAADRGTGDTALANRLDAETNTLHLKIATERSDRIAALAAQLNDLLNGAQVYAGSNHYMGAVVATNTANVMHGKFVGDGSGLQIIPVGSLNGVLGNGQLPGTVVYRPELLSTNAALNAQLNQEAADRGTGDTALANQLDAETNTLHLKIATERSDRIAALAAQLNDLLNGAQFYTGSNHYTGTVVATNTANVLHGKFVGDGSGMQSIPVGSLNGVLGNGQLPGTVVYRPELSSTNAALNAQLNQEAADRGAGDTALANRMDAETNTLHGRINVSSNALDVKIATERSDRIAALAAQLSALLNGDQVYAGSNHYTGELVATNTANVLHGKFVGDGSGLQSLPVGSLNGVLGNGQLPGTVVYRPELLGTNAALNAQLNQEAADRGAGDAALANRMDAETNTLHLKIATERSDRIAALAAQLNDLLNGAQVYAGSNHYTGAVVATNTLNVLHGKFVGDGSGLASLDATKLSNGTLADARLSTQVMLRDGSRTFNSAISGVTPTADLHLATKKYVDDSVTNAAAGSSVVGTVLASSSESDSGYLASGYVRFASIAAPEWHNLAGTGQPATRWGHVSLRAGNQVVVWGGQAASSFYLNDGAIYRSASDDWVTISPIGAPSERTGAGAVWTGSNMVVWGGIGPAGFLNSGGMFDPLENEWRSLSGENQPSARTGHATVWNGSRALVFGGHNFTGRLNDLHGYDPASGSWTSWTPLNPPLGRTGTRAIWTGTRFLVWGGSGNSGELGDGAMLNFTNGLPDSTWVTMASAGAPAAREGHGAVWTGSKLVVWGGANSGNVLGDGAVFDPDGNAWATISSVGAPTGRTGHAMIWSGSEVIVFGGSLATGAVGADVHAYDPVADRWRTLSNAGNPVGRTEPGAIWTGSRLWVFGGRNAGNLSLASGQYLDPQPAWHLYRRQ